MKRLIILLLLSASVFLCSCKPILAEEMPLSIQQIVDKVDRLYRSKTSEQEVEMTIINPNWKRKLTMKMWTEEMDKTFIYITSPKKDAGISTLRIKNEMWNYFPKIDKVMKVPPSMMMGSWMGSDFTNDDLVKESSLVNDYNISLINPDDARPEYYYIELIPKAEAATVWGKIIITARKEDYIPIEEVFYDEKGKKMRVMEFEEIKNFGKRRLPALMEMTSLTKEGHRTVIRIIKASFDKEPKSNIFTLRNLQKRRR